LDIILDLQLYVRDEYFVLTQTNKRSRKKRFHYSVVANEPMQSILFQYVPNSCCLKVCQKRFSGYFSYHEIMPIFISPQMK